MNTAWEVIFDEETSGLSLRNGEAKLAGKLAFTGENPRWTLAASRDGVPDRYALVDPDGDVQGYLVFIHRGSLLEMLFYHRSSQNYRGTLSYRGTVEFPKDNFLCRTRPGKGERVVSFSNGTNGSVGSSTFDSLFSPGSDLALYLKAADMELKKSEENTCLFFLSGQIAESSDAVFTFDLEQDYFKNRYAPYYHPIDRNRCPTPPTGWMSWNTYFDKATAEDNLNEAKIGQRQLLPFGCAFWSIESWQGNSDHLPVRDFYNMDLEINEKQFPRGMKQLADDIRALGFRPGIWIPPWGTGNREFYEAHRSWFLHDTSGRPIGCWNGQYTLDPTVPEAREHLKNIFRIASREWGYEFFKIDGIGGKSHTYASHLYERPGIRACFHDPSCPNPYELCIKAFREGIGEDRVLLACGGHATGPEPLYADAARIGADVVYPDKSVVWEGVFNQGRSFLNQAHTHNIIMAADPDTLLVKGLSPEEARTSATIIALPGQVTFFGDKLAGLTNEEMKILQKTLPALNIHPENLYPFFSMLPVWNLRVHHETIGDYNVVALFNWEDRSGIISAGPEELGINRDVKYTGYEFWTGTAVSIEDKKDWRLSMEVPAHGVRVVVLQKWSGHPQWAGSDRHIAQTGFEITGCAWRPENNTLAGILRPAGTFPLTLRILVPKNYQFINVEANNTVMKAQSEPGGLLAVTFHPEKTADIPFCVYFKHIP
jgi:hypothetical protein